jgi:protein-L-isoaspartate(D-aspartate) O-methyltransferase
MDDDPGKIQLIMALRKQGITDAKILSAIEMVQRELFVSRPFVDRAYENNPLPIACGQTISQPFIVATMCVALEIKERDRVLEIGTGSGYQAAVLSHLCRRVYTIERHPSLQKSAEIRLRDLGYDNVTTLLGDGMLGWEAQAPFDRIIVTAAGTQIPEVLLNQLKEGGILVAPVGESSNDQTLVQIRRTPTDFQQTDLLPVRFVPLLEGVAREP